LQLIPAGRASDMNKIAGLSWWVVAILIAMVGIALMLVNR
jgi:hypothetical protein